MIDKLIPFGKMVTYVVVILLCVGAIGYYVFVIKKRRKWYIKVWEKKQNGKLYLIGQDVLVERKFNKGKQVAYLLKKARVETIPPPDDVVDRLGTKEWANYVRFLEDYIPMDRSTSFAPDHVKNLKEKIFGIKQMSPQQVQNVYIYGPVDRNIVGNINFTPIEYDVNMMRINALDNREKIYQDAKDFLQQWGPYIAIGLCIVLAIVTIYLSYGHGIDVIKETMGTVNTVVPPLQDIAAKLGGNPPPG